jgi:hypothetical protein
VAPRPGDVDALGRRDASGDHDFIAATLEALQRIDALGLGAGSNAGWRPSGCFSSAAARCGGHASLVRVKIRTLS